MRKSEDGGLPGSRCSTKFQRSLVGGCWSPSTRPSPGVPSQDPLGLEPLQLAIVVEKGLCVVPKLLGDPVAHSADLFDCRIGSHDGSPSQFSSSTGVVRAGTKSPSTARALSMPILARPAGRSRNLFSSRPLESLRIVAARPRPATRAGASRCRSTQPSGSSNRLTAIRSTCSSASPPMASRRKADSRGAATRAATTFRAAMKSS